MLLSVSLHEYYHQVGIYSSWINIPVNEHLAAFATRNNLLYTHYWFGSRHGHLSSLCKRPLLILRCSRQSAKQYEEFLLQCCRPSVQFLQDHCCRLELSRKIGKSQTQEQQICHLQSWNDSPRLQILRRTLLWSDCFWQSNKKRYWSVCLGLSYKWRNIWRNKYAEFSTKTIVG